MKNGVPIVVGVIEILSAIAEFATAILDGKPETSPDLNKLLARILAAIAGLKAP
jgi:hypothetical protein